MMFIIPKSKFILGCFKNVVHIRKMCTISGNSPACKILQDYLGIDSLKSKLIISKCKRKVIDTEELLENLKMIQMWGFRKDELIRYPKLLTMCRLQLEQRYLYIKESGFYNVTPTLIAFFRKLIQKRVKELKEHQQIPENLNVAQNLITYLKPLPNDFDVSDLTDDYILSEVHTTIIKRYLAWRLETTNDEIENVFRIYKMILNKSMNFLSQNIALAEELGFTKKKILRSGYILHNYPKYTITMLADFPNFAGADLRAAMKSYPKLIMVSPKQYFRIYGILKQYKIEDDKIQKTMNIFTLSPETVQYRLETLYNTPSLRVLFNNPRILKLIIHHSKATSRLTYLQQLELKCASVLMLESGYESLVEAHVREGHDINAMSEIIYFLKGLFNLSPSGLKANLRRHPFHLHIPIVRMDETFHYLLNKKFSKNSIYKVVQVLLYPKEHIEKALNEIKNSKSERVSLSQVQKLNLILYYMEKDYHFTGNGVWLKSDDKVIE